MLLLVGVALPVVALSYAEGTAALPETGGAATFVRRAFNDQLGFLTGWVLLLDYVIVIALAACSCRTTSGNAVGWDAITDSPSDLFVGIGVIVVMAARCGSSAGRACTGSRSRSPRWRSSARCS